MKLKHLYSICLVLVFGLQISFAQTNDVLIETVKDNDTLIFFGTNNSSIIQDVTLEITEVKGLEGYQKPLTIRLLPNTTDIFHKLAITDAYSYDFVYINEIPMELLIQEDFTAGDDVKINKGIVLFDKTNCGRCEKTKAFFASQGIAYQSLNITDVQTNKELMWSLLRLNGFQGNNIKTPVILVNGEISHSHDDLLGFLETLK